MSKKKSKEEHILVMETRVFFAYSLMKLINGYREIIAASDDKNENKRLENEIIDFTDNIVRSIREFREKDGWIIYDAYEYFEKIDKKHADEFYEAAELVLDFYMDQIFEWNPVTLDHNGGGGSWVGEKSLVKSSDEKKKINDKYKSLYGDWE